jgi:hypothetical protein
LIFYSKGKVIFGQASNHENKVLLSKKYVDVVDSVAINSLGHSLVSFKMNADKDYMVTLVKSKRKVDYDEFLLANHEGFTVKVEKDGISLKRPLLSCKQKTHYWRTFTKESTSHNSSFKK